MSIAIQCSECGYKHQADTSAAGKQVRCTNCGKSISVPLADGAETSKASSSSSASSRAESTNWAAMISPADAPKAAAPAALLGACRTAWLAARQQTPKLQGGRRPASRYSPMVVGIGMSLILLVALGVIGSVMALWMVHAQQNTMGAIPDGAKEYAVVVVSAKDSSGARVDARHYLYPDGSKHIFKTVEYADGHRDVTELSALEAEDLINGVAADGAATDASNPIAPPSLAARTPNAATALVKPAAAPPAKPAPTLAAAAPQNHAPAIAAPPGASPPPSVAAANASPALILRPGCRLRASHGAVLRSGECRSLGRSAKASEKKGGTSCRSASGGFE